MVQQSMKCKDCGFEPDMGRPHDERINFLWLHERSCESKKAKNDSMEMVHIPKDLVKDIVNDLGQICVMMEDGGSGMSIKDIVDVVIMLASRRHDELLDLIEKV